MLQKTQVENYFFAEKTESVIFMIVGGVAIVLALLVTLLLKTKWSFGLAIPIVLLAVLQIAVGWAVYRSADRQRTDVIYAMDLDPASIRDSEIPRMQKVMRNFAMYRYTEMAVLALGLFLVWKYASSSDHALWHGLGCGIAIQAFILLVLDFFAERRGAQYLQGLLDWINR